MSLSSQYWNARIWENNNNNIFEHVEQFLPSLEKFHPFYPEYKNNHFFSSPTNDDDLGLDHSLFDFSYIDEDYESLQMKNIENVFNNSISGNRNKFEQRSNEFFYRQIIGRSRNYYERFGWITMDVPNESIGKSFIINQEKAENLNTIKETNNIKNHKSSTIKKEKKSNKNIECLFCKNVPAQQYNYKTHLLKNSDKKITCPILRAYRCPICKNNGGDYAHTIRYCPLKRQQLANEFKECIAERFRKSFPNPCKPSTPSMDRWNNPSMKPVSMDYPKINFTREIWNAN